ncbi:hypothetical protein FF38_07814 [Lucilia cuprina]|uniref:RING-type domain-containing protein n=1 Tax=Lucilia cuprina TaxID=7375 RepID=A0A0L0BYK7_LUCCU|nr:E3 ubiquitin-protein ligase RNF130 [Lucilia cuprina]KNC25122.1 hypothetical protein FF38_07814 [Lucilia cuprina]
MSTLNILCAICSEYFKQNDTIYSTRCGHVFHKRCLFRWLRRSLTCPQCRKNCLKHNCHQLYINFVETVPNENGTEIEFPKCYDWLYIEPDMDMTDIESFALKFGQDEEGNVIYAARGRFNGDLIPGYYVPQKKSVIVPWGFKSHTTTDDIELLDISNDNAEYKWVAATNGDIPENAFATGHTIMGDVLYTARAKHENMILYGKLHQRYNSAYVPFKDLEICTSTYEILVRKPKKNTTTDVQL